MEEELYTKKFNYLGGPVIYGIAGTFGWIKPVVNNQIPELWLETCREVFTLFFVREDGNGASAYQAEKDHQFVFFHMPDGGINVARFIRECEQRLNLKEFTKMIGCVNADNMSVVYPSPWWFENQLRLQLFSILLRCGLNYKDDFEWALNSVEYARDTRPAVDKFFKGFTKWAGRQTGGVHELGSYDLLAWQHGWVYLFSVLDPQRSLDLMIE